MTESRITEAAVPGDPAGTAADFPWDESQLAAIKQAALGRDLVITGAPGSGKTILAVELASRALMSHDDPGAVLMLTSSRRSAGRAREAVMARAGRSVQGSIVRSTASLAFAIIAAQARMDGVPDPVLTTGPEQDVELAQLLAGHVAGSGIGVPWPDGMTAETIALDGFRGELRDILMRCAERGISPTELAELGREHGRDEWIAVAALYREYLDVTYLSRLAPDRGPRFDSATIVDEAARIARAWVAGDVRSRPRWDCVIVDEYQDATAATARLLSALHDDGAQIVLLADPDQAVQGFRGSRPDLAAIAELPPIADGGEGRFGAEPLVLTGGYRGDTQIRDAVSRISSQIGAIAGVRHRLRPAARPAPEAAPEDTAGQAPVGSAETEPSSETVRRVDLRSSGDESAWIAWTVRWQHYIEGRPWSDYAVIARSGTKVRDLARELQRAGVPARTEGSDVPLRRNPAVRYLLETISRGAENDWDEPFLTDLLRSAYGDLDPVGVRSLRRILSGSDDAPLSRDVFVSALTSDNGLAALAASPLAGTPLAASAYRISSMVRAAMRPSSGEVADALWGVWDAARIADSWRDLALQTGPRAIAADENLDAIMALFKQAEIYAERNSAASIGQFVAYINQFDLPADSLAATSQVRDHVEVLTPAQAAGRQWPSVFVAGVQLGTWPDLRLRDSLLGAQQLADIVDGRGDGRDARAARRSVLDDELRMFLVACSRATRELVITAVSDDEEQPSPLCDLVAGPPPGLPLVAPPPFDLRGIVLRARAAAADNPDDQRWIDLLASLAVEGTDCAHPDTWYGVAVPSHAAPLAPATGSIRVSPSRVALAHACALRWAAETMDARPGSDVSNHIGNLIHEIARDHSDGDVAALQEVLEHRFDELALTPGWPAMKVASDAREMARKLAEFQAEHPDPFASELAFSADIGGVTLRGSMDRVDEGATGFLVTDYKTGRYPRSGKEADVDPQLAAYQVAIEAGVADGDPAGGGPAGGGAVEGDGEAEHRAAGARLVYLGTPAKSAPIRTQRPLRDFPNPHWAHEMVEQSAQIMGAGRMWARISDACRSCPVTASCPLQAEGESLVNPRGQGGTECDAPLSRFGTYEERLAAAEGETGGGDK